MPNPDVLRAVATAGLCLAVALGTGAAFGMMLRDERRGARMDVTRQTSVVTLAGRVDLLRWQLRQFRRTVQVELVLLLFPRGGGGTCGNRTWWNVYVQGAEWKLTRRTLSGRDSYSREELLKMLTIIRQHELVTGWNVPEPDVELPMITVNGTRRWAWPGYLTYQEVLQLAGHNPTKTLSVVWHRGHAAKPDGILSPGQSVRVHDGMVFNIYGSGGTT